MATSSSSSVLTYALALLLPLLLVFYKSRSAKVTSTPPPPAEEEKKPLKTIMQAPNADLLPPKDDPFTVEQLAEFDGSSEGKPIYVAIKGDIFDVSKKADVYGPGKSYHIFAGKDGSRGLGMSSLKAEHAVADYSTLTEAEMKVLDDWHSFFSKRYNIVGKVVGAPAPPAPNM